MSSPLAARRPAPPSDADEDEGWDAAVSGLLEDVARYYAGRLAQHGTRARGVDFFDTAEMYASPPKADIIWS